MVTFAEDFTPPISGEDKTSAQQWFWRGSVSMPTELATGPADDPINSNLVEIGFSGSEAYIITSRQIRAVTPQIQIQALIGEGQGLAIHSVTAQIRQARTAQSANRWVNQLVSGNDLSRFATWARELNGESRTYRLAGQISGDDGDNFLINRGGIENMYVGSDRVLRAYYGTKQLWGDSIFFQTDAGLTLTVRVTDAPPGETGYDYRMSIFVGGIYGVSSFHLQYQPNSTGAWLDVTPQPSGDAPAKTFFTQTVRFPDDNNGIRIRATDRNGAQTPWLEWFSTPIEITNLRAYISGTNIRNNDPVYDISWNVIGNRFTVRWFELEMTNGNVNQGPWSNDSTKGADDSIGADVRSSDFRFDTFKSAVRLRAVNHDRSVTSAWAAVATTSPI